MPLSKPEATILKESPFPEDLVPAGAREAGSRMLEALAESPFFGRLTPQSLAPLAVTASFRRYKAGETIRRRGEMGNGLGLVVSGIVDIYLLNSAGRKRIISQMGPGKLLGISALPRDSRFPCWFEAAKPTETLFLPLGPVHELLASNPVATFLMEIMSRRLNIFWDLLESDGERVMPRLASFLLDLADDSGRAQLPMTKCHLAMRLGTTPESLSRALSRLKSAGAVREVGRGLSIVDRQRLSEIIIDCEGRL
jgi:CRP/FNR family transcriptional regulator